MSVNPQKLLNINTFLSQARKSGFSRLNRIAINIKPPQELLDILKFKGKDDYLTYYAESVTMPGVELGTTNINFGGPIMKVPVSTDYREVTTTFIVDDDMRQKMFFDAWVNYINPKENKFDFRYRDDYIGEIDIVQISEDGNRVSYGCKLYEAYPVIIGDIRGSWAESEPVRLDVTFSYRYWRSLNADRFERSDDDAPEMLDSIDVIGVQREKEILTSIDVIGKRRESEVLTSIDVTGRRSGTEVLTSIDVTGRRRENEVLESITVTGRRRSR